jgi:hypothetical protein
VSVLSQALFELLASNGYRMTEAEVKVFMPGLVEKCGQPQPNVKADCRCARTQCTLCTLCLFSIGI